MRRTETPQIVVSIISIVFTIIFCLTGFRCLKLLLVSAVFMHLGGALMIDYDKWICRKKDERLTHEAIKMLEQKKEHEILNAMHLMDEWKRT